MKQHTTLDSFKSIRKPMPRPTFAIPMKKKTKLNKIIEKEIRKEIAY